MYQNYYNPNFHPVQLNEQHERFGFSPLGAGLVGLGLGYLGGELFDGPGFGPGFGPGYGGYGHPGAGFGGYGHPGIGPGFMGYGPGYGGYGYPGPGVGFGPHPFR